MKTEAYLPSLVVLVLGFLVAWALTGCSYDPGRICNTKQQRRVNAVVDECMQSALITFGAGAFAECTRMAEEVVCDLDWGVEF